ncbi:hypothetical protein [Caballeronia sp. BR00000012568055]|uniref:hypothetical protein n=1 Tax=Caballeronia sp. BR00000012568055 TaxID=2918761 RepID=UPI0023F7C954|nr:hypothetical protein [Caballeronia sp. BR00000012568055]
MTARIGDCALISFRIESLRRSLSHKLYLTIRNDVAAMRGGRLAVNCLIGADYAEDFRQGWRAVLAILQNDGVILTRFGAVIARIRLPDKRWTFCERAQASDGMKAA